ncbi:hypothetical protein HIM_08468 [Hirsutella minnesotensis 3608]|uniref:G-protein coupled receptors family 2 profile 2 domain-containing protein n=1 Tax=Hirsutella minnesotensis 3608 TaxID=1043627 RepID=A0A0F7ZSZ1_9HYPO|nr:hypothetical protein HIM_08468 [Hirsutella minnesotensis 3608]
MANVARANLCIPPFIDDTLFTGGGYVEGRLCQTIGSVRCCAPCPVIDWIYSDEFKMTYKVSNWLCLASGICCAILLVTWAVLPPEKTHRHYLSSGFVAALLCMNLGFIVPLFTKPQQCFDAITPHDMRSSATCGATGTFLIYGGWAVVVWAFLRSLSLFLQIYWHMGVGRKFMIASHVIGWGVPLIGLALALGLSGVSFRFGASCHINHPNSLGDLWIPILTVAGATVVLTFFTFGYCINVYLAALGDNSTVTQGSNDPDWNSMSLSPRRAYRRIKRIFMLQWRGIAIVAVIVTEVILFSVVLVFQDQVIQSISSNPLIAQSWVLCLMEKMGDKNQCLDKARAFTVNEKTVSAILLLFGMSGISLFVVLVRPSMITGWYELFRSLGGRNRKEFVSVDARHQVEGSRTIDIVSGKSIALTSPLSPTFPVNRVDKPSVTVQTEQEDSHTPLTPHSTPRHLEHLLQSPPQSPGFFRDQHDGGINPLGMHQV